MTKRQQPRLLWFTRAQSVGYVLRTLKSSELFFSDHLTGNDYWVHVFDEPFSILGCSVSFCSD